MSEGLRSGQVAEAAGVNIQTLRYYERRGLLAEPVRSPGGHRLYGDDAVTALRVIKAAQRLGFTLDEVADLLELGHAPGLGGRSRTVLVVSTLLVITGMLCELIIRRQHKRPARD